MTYQVSNGKNHCSIFKIKRNDLRGRPSKDSRQMLNGQPLDFKNRCTMERSSKQIWPVANGYQSGTSCLKNLEKSADSESISIDTSYVKLQQHGTDAKRGISHKRSGKAD